jgi:hypothetical protein
VIDEAQSREACHVDVIDSCTSLILYEREGGPVGQSVIVIALALGHKLGFLPPQFKIQELQKTPKLPDMNIRTKVIIS